MILAIILLTALINIALGVISYNKNPRSATHRLLTLLTVIFALWGIANYFSLNSATKEDTLFWIRAVMFITAPMGPILYLFVRAFPHAELSINKLFLRVLIGLILLVQVLSFTPILFSDVIIANGSITPVPGQGIALYALLLIGAPLLGFVELIKKYRNTSGLERLQLKYLILGITETFVLLIITNFVAVVLFHYSGFVIFGPIFSLILVGFISYAIIRHRLLEIRLIIARSVLYTLLIFVIAVLYTLGIFLLSSYIFGERINIEQEISHVLLALFVSFTFVPLRNFIENRTNRLFYKGNYDQHDLVYQLTRIIASNIALEDVTTRTLQKLLSTLRIGHGAFLILKKNRQFEIFSKGKAVGDYDKRILKTLNSVKKMAIFDEEQNKKVKSLMRANNIAIVLPLFERDEKVGILLLGDKKTGQIYSQRDIGVLEIFGPAISVAIQNAKSYEAIKNFNITLKKEVQSATKDLKSANEKLKELGKQKDDFMAIASHELKTPVTSIKLYTQLLHQKFKKLNDTKSAESVAKMDMQLNKLISLINDLLDVTKIEEGKLQFNFKKFNINKLINEITEEMQLTTKHRIEKDLGSGGDVYADQERIGQVLTNFISNAIKYSPDANKIIIKTTNGNKLTVSIQDFGMGLTASEQKKVFERFNRAGQEGKGGMPGLGLGLYISKEIVKRHNGEIWVESKKGKGSTFSFSLPIK